VTLAEVLVEAWRQVLEEGRDDVELAGHRSKVGRTRGQGLRTVAFLYEGHRIEAIEQNPTKTSRWAQLARDGKRIVQFRSDRRYIANVCDGVLTRYSAWKAAGLPD
jgi:hypothetical protein